MDDFDNYWVVHTTCLVTDRFRGSSHFHTLCQVNNFIHEQAKHNPHTQFIAVHLIDGRHTTVFKVWIN